MNEKVFPLDLYYKYLYYDDCPIWTEEELGVNAYHACKVYYACKVYHASMAWNLLTPEEKQKPRDLVENEIKDLLESLREK